MRYDWIIRNYDILNSRKVGIPENVCKLRYNAHERLKFHNQLNNNISKIIYKYTKEFTLHDIDQGSVNGRYHWNFINISIMDTVEEEVPGCIIMVPKGKEKW